MHPAWFTGPKTDKQSKELMKECFVCVGLFTVIFIVVALTQNFAKDCLSDFIEWTCSFNGTLDVEVLWEQIKNSIGMK